MNYLSVSMKHTGNNNSPSDDLVTFWRSKPKGQGHTLVQVCGGEENHGDNGLIEVHLENSGVSLMMMMIIIIIIIIIVMLCR